MVAGLDEGSTDYRVTWAPYAYSGALPPWRFLGENSLSRFLENLGIEKAIRDGALTELQRERTAFIPRVNLPG